MAQIEQGQVYFDLPPFVAWQSEADAYIPSQISNSEFTQWLLQLFGLSSNGAPLPLNTVGLTVDPVLGITDSLAQLLLANGVQLYEENGNSALPSSFSVNFLTIVPLSLQGDWDSNSAIFTPTLELILSGQAIEYSVEFNFIGLNPSFGGPLYPSFNVSILPDRDGLYSNIQDQAALASYLTNLGTLSEQQIQAELASFVTGLADNIYAVSRVNAFNLLAAYGTELNGTGSTVVLYNNLIVPTLTYAFSLDTNGYQLIQGSKVEEYGNTYLYIQDSPSKYITQQGSTIYSVTRDGQDISPTTYAGFSAVGAESVSIGLSSVNQLLWTNGTSNADGTAATAGTTAFVWSLTSEWDYSSATSATIGYDTLGLETTFTYDLNDDGYIGQYYTTFEANGNAGLYIAGVAGPSGNQYFASALPGTPSYKGITRAGQDITTTTYAGYSAVSAQIVSGVNQLLWTDGTLNANGTVATAGTTAFVWSLTSEWDYSSATSEAIGSSLQSQALEKTFYYDLDGLNGISNPVADGVTRITVQSSVDVITGSILDQFYIALAPTGSIAFAGGGGSDAFQLYTSAGVQFASTGGADYMTITDFSSDDKIVLLGISNDYAIVNSGSVSSLYYGSSASGDLIASISTPGPLDLNSSQFVYTSL